ncbi:hypothetical protein DYB32_003523 [Aphanomyces invadans]|uniref:RING-type E3 ubiquitin transferase n=1 Tax=Aphanomyces invadans TaxID=157072 RepID=A0A418B0C5_9STRA|nr:hypothetical protein DYB32_003523 [Aphanomyces invadans]
MVTLNGSFMFTSTEWNTEPGRRLFAPCKCSGSIRFVHSDCLTEWLAICKKDICELCGYKFSFQPVYAEGSPRTLPTQELLLSVVIVALKKWLPLVIRAVLVFLAWGVVAPWCTSWLYRLWLLRAATMGSMNLNDRLQNYDLILADVLSGIVLVVVIVCSFLSLMSFADFLRFNMDRIMEEPLVHDDAEELRHREMLVAQEMEAVEMAVPQPLHQQPLQRGQQHNHARRLIERIDGVDEWLGDHDESDSDNDASDDSDEDGPNGVDLQFARRVHEFRVRQPMAGQPEPVAPLPQRDMHPRRLRLRIQDNLPLFDHAIQLIPHAAVFRPHVARNVRPDPRVAEANNANPRRRRPLNGPAARNNVQNNQGDGLNNPWDDDLDHMEINIAMDEVIGFRGPPYVLLRNVCWFLAFNGAYLGILAFLPYTLGSTIVVSIAKGLNQVVGEEAHFDPVTSLGFDASSGWAHFVGKVANTTSLGQSHGDCLQLVDVLTCGVGYFGFCVAAMSWRVMVNTISLYTPHPLLAGMLGFLSCMNALVKVGALLLLKMIVLPIILGYGLDAATLTLFLASPWDRLDFFLDQMLTSLMVHWVLGISFMLFVTVAVLQLREVMHPDILAATIRPQEPNQDILKSMLAESSVKHARRMVLSLAIYAMLLTTLVFLPVRLAYMAVPTLFPVQFTFHYVFAPLQVPLELVLAHMTVLNILDTYKHELGHMQAKWMSMLCRRLGLVEYLLPRVPALPTGASPSIDDSIILGVPPLSFNPVNDPPPVQERLYGARYVPWPEDGLVDPTVVEYNLLPRTIPTHLSLRLGALMACCWVTTVIMIGMTTMSPLYLGRLSMAMLEQFSGLRHDSLNAAAGVVAMWVLINGFKLCRVFSIQDSDVHPQLLAQGFSMRHLSRTALVQLGMHAFGFVVLHLFVWCICYFPLTKRRHNQNVEPEVVAADAPAPVDRIDELRQAEPTVVNSMQLGFEQLRFHVQSNDDGVEHARDLRHRRFDIQRFHDHVIVPLGRAIVVCTVLPWMCTKAYAMLGWSNLNETHVFRAAFATQVFGLAIITSKSTASSWFRALHDSIRDERYLVGKQLQDMVR